MNAQRGGLFDLGHPNRRALQGVIWLHAIECVALLLLLGFCRLIAMALPYGPLFGVIAGFSCWTVVAWWRLERVAEDHDCTHALSLHLAVAVMVIATLLYLSGGAGNPFVSLLLLPIAMAAISLPWKPAALIAVLAAGAYTLLLWFFQSPAGVSDGGLHAHHQASAFSMHVTGMWINFLASGSFLLGFLLWLATIARERTARLSRLRELRARDEQLLAMAGVAAGAAHSLATPLSTIGVALDELLESAAEGDREIIMLAREQLTVCRERLAEVLLSARAGAATGLQGPVHALLSAHLRQWHLLRPEADLRVALDLPVEQVVLDPAIGHGLTTVLDNAIDAGMSAGELHVAVRATCENGVLCIEVEDHGGGPVPSLDRLPTVSAKRHGAAAGLMILRANLDRLGGEMAFRAGELGTIARIRVPVGRGGQP